MAKSVVFNNSGAQPALKLITHDIPKITSTPNQVLLKFLAVPVNRVDLMVLKGQYPLRPQFSIEGQPVPGFDGCAIVLESSSSDFTPGDMVIPSELGLGTWRTHALLPAQSLIKLPRDTPPVAASLIRSSAMIAWLLCEEVTPLTEGDWVIMSAGTSCVASFFAQFAQRRGIKTALVIRDRPDFAETAARLADLGASAVLSESQLACDGVSGMTERLVLALDCVSGTVGQHMVNSLSTGGKYVMVGMLSRSSHPLSISTEQLFQKQLSILPFRGSEVLKRRDIAKTVATYEMLARLLIDGEIKCPKVRIQHWSDSRGSSPALEAMVNESIQEGQSDVGDSGKVVWLLY